MSKSLFFVSIMAFALSACATKAESTLWIATGYLSPSMAKGEFLGSFNSEAACVQAVEAWKSQQVVGNPVSGSCEKSAPARTE